MKSKNNYFQKKNLKSKVWHILISSIVGLFIFAVLMSVFSLVLCNIDIPLSALSPIAMGAVCVAVLFAGMALARLEKKRGLIYGAFVGVFVFLLLWVSSILQGGILMSQLAVIKAFSIICSGCLGGYLGVTCSEKRRKIR